MENKVELIGFYGSDITHAQSAWTSTSRDLTDDKINRIPELLKMLAENGHETPFEKSSLHFLVTCDQASHIHLLKHRIGVSINAESARYKELKEDKFYMPEDWSGIAIGEYADIDPSLKTWFTTLKVFSEGSNELYHKCLHDLTPVLGRKRAKESARFFKLMNSQITMDVMFNFRSFVHFQRLRNSKDAQKEIADIADKMLELVESIEGNPFEYTLKAFNL
jgi:flavin-dependent thymidylate synthase